MCVHVPWVPFVACSSGVGRSGVYITLHITLERMKTEGLVDIFQTVKTLRIQRPAMVQTLVITHTNIALLTPLAARLPVCAHEFFTLLHIHMRRSAASSVCGISNLPFCDLAKRFSVPFSI